MEQVRTKLKMRQEELSRRREQFPIPSLRRYNELKAVSYSKRSISRIIIYIFSAFFFCCETCFIVLVLEIITNLFLF